jgi:N-acetylglutamate synthase-like GNAT family acetyltransferase
MSIQLREPFVSSNRLNFRKVSTDKDIRQWCASFQQSFNYQISEETLEKSVDQISYFNIFFENQIAGTLILHVTNNVAGIHSLGIVPQWRGHGFAKEAMYFTLNKAIELKANYATLQASEMARSMYKNLGFSENFIMRNYQIKK